MTTIILATNNSDLIEIVCYCPWKCNYCFCWSCLWYLFWTYLVEKL